MTDSEPETEVVAAPLERARAALEVEPLDKSVLVRCPSSVRMHGWGGVGLAKVGACTT